MSENRDVLALARRHVAEGEARVSRQEALIAELARGAHDTTEAISLLHTFRETLNLMRQHLEYEEAQARK
jgi:hypothetical protein